MLCSLSTREHLAGHEGREPDDPAVLDERPLAVRARAARPRAACAAPGPPPARRRSGSPRRGSRRARRRAPISDRPGTKWSRRPAVGRVPREPARRARRCRRGRGSRAPRRQPCREVIMPDASTGSAGAAASQAPISRSSTASKSPSGDLEDAGSGASCASSTAAVGADPVGAKRGRAPVDADQRGALVHAISPGPRARYGGRRGRGKGKRPSARRRSRRIRLASSAPPCSRIAIGRSAGTRSQALMISDGHRHREQRARPRPRSSPRGSPRSAPRASEMLRVRPCRRGSR